MNNQIFTNFNRIAEAIEYIRSHFETQHGLEEVAEKVHLSPYHFQRMFSEWAGVSPKKFLEYISLEHAKKMLKEGQASLFNAALDTGLSGTGRLHGLFINIEGMTPGEYKNEGENLEIHYSFDESPFGELLVASTPKGICYLAFVADEEASAVEALRKKFPKARYRQMAEPYHQSALHIFKQDWNKPDQIKLHLKGTEFQLKVWEALLKIPMGKLASYGDIAKKINHPKACRAVGSAVGDNPVFFLIPCHRVIQSSGAFGNYYWGSEIKTAIIGWESAKVKSP